ncbi:hypothetical protein [Streptomyces sp. NRRL F-5630]|uniref:hypothetical protein n=1 Tax=Streptomyces sp. NRRL F-5630 TaxID=1463864 RepID=UPI003EBFCDCF
MLRAAGVGCVTRGATREARLAALAEELPDEDRGEDMRARADAHRFGGEPRREAAERRAPLTTARE